MQNTIKTLISLTIVSLLPLWGACGKKDEGKSKEAASAVQTETAEDEGLPLAGVPFNSEIVGAGYEVVYFTYFPATVAGKTGRMILYGSASGGKDGGMVYVEESGPDYEWVWHWYFEDRRPTRAQRVEVNDDGLWDVRVYTDAGRQFDILQDDTFTLIGGARKDRIALNGVSSEPLEEHPLWYCFDGNRLTAFASEVGRRSKPFIEVSSPFGLADGILSIQTSSMGHPKDCDLVVDGKKVQSFQLEETTDEQLVQLDAAAKTAKHIRLVINSCHEDSRVAAIAELSIR